MGYGALDEFDNNRLDLAWDAISWKIKRPELYGKKWVENVSVAVSLVK